MKPHQPSAVRSLSVLIPTRDGEAFLDRVLAALAAQRVPLPWELLVIDSGSTDRTLAILEEWRGRFPVPIRVERIHPDAFDHGDTRNLLAARSEGDLLVFLTQDAIPTGPEWLATLARNFEDPRVGAAYSRNLPRPDAQLLTRVFSENDPGYAPCGREQRLPDAATYAAMDPHEKRLLFNLNDVAAAYRRDLWERHPFPRTAFGEDVLMARALIEAGYSVVYDDVATVEHSHDYGPAEMRRRARTDGEFNAEWLGRVCVASRRDADALTERQLDRDRRALEEAGVRGAELERQLAHARDLRRAAFLGLYEGGRSPHRRPRTRMLERTRLRVLYVVHGFPPETWAGTEVYTLGLAREVRRLGHEVVILARTAGEEGPGDDAGAPDFSLALDDFDGLPVWRMTHRARHANLRESYHQPGAEAAFRRVLREVRPDVVHFQHLIHFSAGLPHLCRELDIPSVITVNDYWALCPRVQLIRPDGVRCEESQGHGCLLCVKEHHYELIPAAKRVLPLLEPAAALLRAGGRLPRLGGLAASAGELRDIAARHDFVCAGYAACDLVIAPSRFLRGKLLETGRFDPHRVVYSDYGTRTDHLRPLERRTDPAGRIRFGFVGSLLWYKGVELLLRAMARIDGDRAALLVFGDFDPGGDPYHAGLAALARELGDRVSFRGRFDNRELASVYEQFDVLVVPSIWFENSPITIHEAFLLRTPVVTSDAGGMAELVTDGANGLHFRIGDADDLAAKLRRFLDEPDLIGRLSDFPPVKTMAEDAREMEYRYRALACVARERVRSGEERPAGALAGRG